ncbi:hypothetical protein KY334_05385, partial [Candidatus Woesearchaeota archaeon]|nr:hypothetical protein [Candidatus Woesearchaeota archaeon]
MRVKKINLPKIFKIDPIYFHPLARIPYLNRLKVALMLSGNIKNKEILDAGFGYGQLMYVL